MNHKLWFLLLAVLVVGCGKGGSKETPKATALERAVSLTPSPYLSRSGSEAATGTIVVPDTIKMVTGPATVYVIQGMKVRGTFQVLAGTTEDITTKVNNLDNGVRPLYYGWFQNLSAVPEPTNPAYHTSCVVCSSASRQPCCPR
jgi:hypothetical protein